VVQLEINTEEDEAEFVAIEDMKEALTIFRMVKLPALRN
jgi:hypothetical protein